MPTKKTVAKKVTAKKTAKKATKKTAKKVAAKKATKKVAKKTAKKATKKRAKKVVAVEQELNLDAKAPPSFDDLKQAAYLNYLERSQNGLPGSPESDWAKAESDLA